jgi:hypothetical protein
VNIFRQLIDGFKGLQEQLARVEADPSVKRFGEPVRKARRIEQIGVWRDGALNAIAGFRTTELPKLQTQRQADTAAARKIIARGGLLASKDLPNRDSLNGDVVSKLDTFERALLDGVRGLSRQLAVSNAFTVAQLSTTEDLQRQIEQYSVEARTAPTFPLVQFSADRIAIPIVLAGRAGSDPRAGMALTAFVEIEKALIARAAPDALSSGEGEDLQELEDRISGAVRGGEENLTPASEFISFMARGLERQEAHAAANPPILFPKNRE